MIDGGFLIEAGTWLAVAILGLGSVGIFIWFLGDLRGIMRRVRERPRARSRRSGADL